jgi:hypothetical protein
LEAPALFGGFGAVEAGLFEAEPAPGEAAGEDVEGDVGGVLLMVAEGGDGIFGGGLAVGVGGGADGGVADGGSVKAEEGLLAEAEVVEGGELHEEVVRVLAVDDGLAEGGLALLEELGILAACDGAGSRENMARRGSCPYLPFCPSCRMAMGMIQFVEKSLSPPRCPVVDEFEAACCWMSERKARPWSMSIQP